MASRSKFRVDETSNLDARIRLKGEGIGLHLWCPSLSLYQEAMSHRNWLKEVAESVGLQISELHIFPSEKVSPQRSVQQIAIPVSTPSNWGFQLISNSDYEKKVA